MHATSELLKPTALPFIFGPCAALVLLGCSVPAASDRFPLQLWPVDPLVKVFRDATPEQPGPAEAAVARGEHASLQVVVRAEGPIQQLKVHVSPLLSRYARNMAEHRHNVALISPLALANFSAGPDGALQIDFARFDRWVEIFRRAGVIGRIEGGHIGGRQSGWESEFVVNTRSVKDNRVVNGRADPASQEADIFYARFFPALVAHLKAKNWLGIYMQHLARQPLHPHHPPPWRASLPPGRRSVDRLPRHERPAGLHPLRSHARWHRRLCPA